MVGRRGEVGGAEKRWEKKTPLGQGGSRKKKTDAGREMIIRETGSTGSSSTGALVAVNSLQPFTTNCH